MSSRAATVKVGLLTILSIALLVFTLVWLRGRGIFAGESFDVVFQDVDGLRESAPVQMMGIRIGFVDTVEPEYVDGRYQVRIKFDLSRQGVSLPRGSRVSIQQSGIIGEKFIEITPPQPQPCELVDLSHTNENAPTPSKLTIGAPVKYLYEHGWLSVGQIDWIGTAEDEADLATQQHVEKLALRKIPKQAILYRHDVANVNPPENAVCEVRQGKNGIFLAVTQNHHAIKSPFPDTTPYFTIEEPMRLKKFLDIQLETAEALKSTNLKIGQLLTDDLIASLSKTVENTEELTARATVLMDAATQLLEGAGEDIRALVKTTNQLAAHLTTVSKQVEDVLGDETLKNDLRQTIASIRSASGRLDALLGDPALKDTLTYSKRASKDASELLSLMNRTAHDPEFQQDAQQAFTELHASIEKLNRVLSTVDKAVHNEDAPLKETLEEAHKAVDNIEGFTDKLDGHFTLFRLLF